MAGGNNREFLANPAKYAASRIILVPSDMGSWQSNLDGPFDLSDAGSAGFGSGTVLLTTFTNRRKADSTKSSHQIPGYWVAYEPNQAKSVKVKATGPGYCIFTTALGGCALAIADRSAADTTFTHDAREKNQLSNLPATAVSFRDGDPGYPQDGREVAAFFWWNGTQWNLGFSKSYDANGHHQLIGADNYPKATGSK